MDAATQEWIALGIVVAVVVIAIWRRVAGTKRSGCSSCEKNPHSTASGTGEKPIHFKR